MAKSNNMKILNCKKIVVRNLEKIEEKLGNWFLQNKWNKVRFITQSYIPLDRNPENNEEKDEETGSFYLYTIFFEKP